MQSHIDSERSHAARRHVRFGWWSLLCFASLGLGLEALHGFKVAWYLTEAFAVRRLMWTLAHTHGTLLALVHLAFASAVRQGVVARWRLPSRCLGAASILLPGGFFAAGTVIYEGDPGLGIFLVPVGAALFLIGVFAVAVESSRVDGDPDAKKSNAPPEIGAGDRPGG